MESQPTCMWTRHHPMSQTRRQMKIQSQIAGSQLQTEGGAGCACSAAPRCTFCSGGSSAASASCTWRCCSGSSVVRRLGRASVDSSPHCAWAAVTIDSPDLYNYHIVLEGTRMFCVRTNLIEGSAPLVGRRSGADGGTLPVKKVPSLSSLLSPVET